MNSDRELLARLSPAELPEVVSLGSSSTQPLACVIRA
jgi:hypothetical protein